MKVSEKSLELNIGAELLNLLRCSVEMSKAYLRGLTQCEENKEGVDFFAQLDHNTRIFAFQFKAPKDSIDKVPYKFTLKREQHTKLHELAQKHSGAVYYVLPFYASHKKLEDDVPELLQDTWFLPVAPMTPDKVFGTNKTKVICCHQGIAFVNPEYELLLASNMEITRSAGIPAMRFASWYKELRGHNVTRKYTRRMDPWLVRGLRVAIIQSNE